MKWTYQFPPLTVEAEYLVSPSSRAGSLYGYLEMVVLSGEMRMLKDRRAESGSSLDDIEIKASKWAKALAKKVMKTGGDFVPD